LNIKFEKKEMKDEDITHSNLIFVFVFLFVS